jgi:Fur family ferric uptake transcriptional regulator
MAKKQYKTKGRAILVEYLKKEASATPQSAEAIFWALSGIEHAPAQSSVYRLLGELCAAGEVRKYRAGSGFFYQYVGERACQNHFHLQCLVCGEVMHLDCACSDEIAAHLLRAHSFAVNRGKSVLYGTCAQCAASEVEV